MPLRVSFELGDGDLQHFEQIAQQTQAIDLMEMWADTENIARDARRSHTSADMISAQGGPAKLA